MRNILFIDVKEFLSDKINRVFIAVIIFGSLLFYQQYYNNIENQKESVEILKAIESSKSEIFPAIEKAERKVDFRYFNLTRTLAEIHKVEINTRDGRIIK